MKSPYYQVLVQVDPIFGEERDHFWVNAIVRVLYNIHRKSFNYIKESQIFKVKGNLYFSLSAIQLIHISVPTVHVLLGAPQRKKESS